MKPSVVIAAAAFSIGVTGSVYATDTQKEDTDRAQSSVQVVPASKKSDDQRSEVRSVDSSKTGSGRRRDVNDSPAGSDPATGIPYSASHGYGWKRW
jgi:hypothetical protein